MRTIGRGRSLQRRVRAVGAAAYLNVAHSGLERPALLAGLKAAGNVRCFVLVHDLIPLHFPELAPPGMAERHRRRLQSACRFADAIIVNSAATAAGLADFAADEPRSPPIIVAALGTDNCVAAGRPNAGVQAGRAYFVALGNLEPRKNHILLLTIWRRLVGRLGVAAPQLHLVGRRSEGNAQALWLLERSEELDAHVVEHAGLGDNGLARLIRGARALLAPSLAEGFDLPVVETLALGTPVVCSDIAAHREVGQGVPQLIDPLDGLGWEQAILNYAAPGSLMRAAQQARLTGFRAPRWADHFAIVEHVIAQGRAG